MVISVDVQGAAFPVTVDPLITTETKLLRGQVADIFQNDKFGAAVAVHKDTAVVGTPDGQYKVPVTGAAYVFVKQGSTWLVQAKLVPFDGALWDLFGKAVAINGDTVVVGAGSDDDKGSNSGSAYIYVRQGLAWSLQKKIVPADGAGEDYFGTSVAVSGDTLAVGAEKDDDKGLNSGSVYIYTRTGTTWSLQKKLVAADGGADDGFGRFVAMHKDTLAVGSPRDDDKGGNAGAVYIYTRTGTSWTQQQKLVAGGGGAGDAFGWCVAVEGDTVAAGAPWEEAPAWDSGAAYIFARSGTSWTQQQKLVGKNLSVVDNFGYFVSLSGDKLAVGAPKDDVTVADQGAVHVFTRSGTTWSQSGMIAANDAKPADFFGGTVIISGSTVFVGAHKDDVIKGDEGSMYVYTLSGSTWSLQQKVLAARPGGSAGDWLGSSVALDGDTAVVGSPRNDDKGVDSGSVHVFLRGKSGWSYQQMLLPNNPDLGDNFGHAVAVSGDTAVVGAPLDRPSLIAPRFGAAYVFTRSGTTWTQQYLVVGATAQEQFGHAVALHKDTMVAGAPYNYLKGTDAGETRVFVRSGTTWTQQQKLVPSSISAGDQYGQAVALSGDTVIVGAPRNDDKGSDSGSAFVFSRGGTVWTQQKQLHAADAAAGDQFGSGMTVEGTTALVGAPYDDDKGTDSGSAYVFSRSGTAWTQQQKLVAADLSAGAHFGGAQAVYNDTIAVGASGLASGAGAVYVFLRSGTKWTMEKKITASDATAKDQFGCAVALSGGTAVVGAFGNDDPDADVGAAYSYKLQRPNGVQCLSAGQCSSGHCVEGVCCDKACGGGQGGDCQACTKAKGATVDGTCVPLKASQTCRLASGGCDAAETCDGTNTACPADTVRTASHICRAKAGDCDEAENCNGLTKTCPTDKLVAKDKTCRQSASDCDLPEVCDGVTAKCPVNTFKAKGTVCRASTAPCDAAEKCDGTVAPCSSDKLETKGTVCRASTAPCDAAEECDGLIKDCPTDKISVKGAVCRKPAGGCDLAETCDGVATTCPPDKLVIKGTSCRKIAGDCDVAEVCSGLAAQCPADVVKLKGTVCRVAVAGGCDEAESCDGSSGTCPTDAYKAKGAVCRKAAGDCDEAETCGGTTVSCPADVYKAKGEVCRKAAGECDVAEACGGSTTSCPADLYQPTGTSCLKGAGSCKAGKCEKVDDAGLDSTAEAGTDAGTDQGTDRARADKAVPDQAKPDQGGDIDPEENGCSCQVSEGSVPGGWLWGMMIIIGTLWFRRRLFG